MHGGTACRPTKPPYRRPKSGAMSTDSIDHSGPGAPPSPPGDPAPDRPHPRRDRGGRRGGHGRLGTGGSGSAPTASNPSSPRTGDAARTALEYSFFRWTLTPWAIYGMAGLALAYAGFRKARGNRLSAAFVPLIGARHADGRPGFEWRVGLGLEPGRLLAVDWVPGPDRPPIAAYVYDGGVLTGERLKAIRLQEEEAADDHWIYVSAFRQPGCSRGRLAAQCPRAA
ncbi:BCCT family transporter [Streptomyces sp. NPDC058301]|uniref:BCCT family transporter n=1 Tax=Streptomyces sp. NPDC058301 TaxID=3346436 RepID=UPI0036E30670